MLTALRPSSGSTAGIRQTFGATGCAPGSVQSATLGGCGTRSLPFESGTARTHANLTPVRRALAVVCARSLSRSAPSIDASNAPASRDDGIGRRADRMDHSPDSSRLGGSDLDVACAGSDLDVA